MNAVTKRLRPKPSFHPPTQARQDAPLPVFTRPPQALSHPPDPTPAKTGALPEGRAPSVGFSSGRTE
ncbi:MAG: hypothetical protein ABI945_03880, partial [Nitrospirales bacterium]